MLEIDVKSQAYIDNAIRALKESAAGSKVAFSSYTHAAFDQESRIITGDARWKVFAEQAQNLDCIFYPLTWEMQPPGVLNDVTILLPNKNEISKSKIRSGLSTVCWWLEASPEVLERVVNSVMNRDKWVSARNYINKQLAAIYPQAISDRVIDQFDELQEIYSDTFRFARGKRLSEISEMLYQRLSGAIFGGLADDFLVDRLSYFGSKFGGTMANRAITGLNEGWLQSTITNLFLYDKGLFIGGEWGRPFMIICNRESRNFAVNQIDPRSGVVIPFSKRIEIQEIIDLLQSRTIMPTGKLFDALMVLGENELVIHDGNDYGGPNIAKRLLLEAQGDYQKLFPDDQDSFTPIVFNTSWDVKETPASLATMFLWDIEPGLWVEKLKQASLSGKPQSVDVFKEVAKC